MNNSRNNLSDLKNKFLRFETDNNLFELNIKGIKFWKRIRYKIFREVALAYGYYSKAHDDLKFTARNKFKIAFNAVVNALRNSPVAVDESELIVIGHPRRILDENDRKYWDIYIDTFIEEIPLTYIALEEIYKGGHLTPCKNPNIKYLDIFTILTFMLAKIPWQLSKKDIEALKVLNEKVNNDFNVDIKTCDFAVNAVLRGYWEKFIYRKILGRISPKLAIIVVSYGKESFIEVCHEKKIPVIELQHGVITDYHMGYVLPKEAKDRIYELLPDYMFVFGQLWQDMGAEILDGIKTIVTGFPYYEIQKNKYKEKIKKKQILFISQGTIGEKLSLLAVDLAGKIGGDYKIIYKLHPGEFLRYKEDYPWLLSSDIEVLKNERNLYDLMSESMWLVGVYSTAIFEGIGMNTRVILADLPGAENVTFLLDYGLAKIAGNAEEIVEIIYNDDNYFDGGQDNYCFENNSSARIKDALIDIYHRKAAGDKQNLYDLEDNK